MIALQRRLTVSRDGNALQASADLPTPSACWWWRTPRRCTIETPAQARMTVDLGQAPEGSTPACVKLLRAGELVDVAEL